MLNATWPLVRFEATAERLVVDALFLPTRVVPRSAVTRILEHSGFVSSGLRIEGDHVISPLILWLDDVPDVARRLGGLGYPVELAPRPPPRTPRPTSSQRGDLDP